MEADHYKNLNQIDPTVEGMDMMRMKKTKWVFESHEY
jgi:hypothetical protein